MPKDSEFYILEKGTAKGVEGGRVAIFLPGTEKWVSLGESDYRGRFLYSEEKYRGVYKCRARHPRFIPFESTIKFNSPTIIFLLKDKR